MNPSLHAAMLFVMAARLSVPGEGHNLATSSFPTTCAVVLPGFCAMIPLYPMNWDKLIPFLLKMKYDN
jgi:hypothetical protein